MQFAAWQVIMIRLIEGRDKGNDKPETIFSMFRDGITPLSFAISH